MLALVVAKAPDKKMVLEEAELAVVLAVASVAAAPLDCVVPSENTIPSTAILATTKVLLEVKN